MKRGLEAKTCGLKQISLLTGLLVLGSLPAVRSVVGEDQAFGQGYSAPKPQAVPEEAKPDAGFEVDQIHAQLQFLSVPAELVDATVSDWILSPFDATEFAAADPFGTMHRPLQRPDPQSKGKSGGTMGAGTEMRIPSVHKVLNDQETQQLVGQLKKDERTQSVFRPQLAFIDGVTATAVVGEKTPFVVGWKDGLPQTRTVPQGKMVRLRTVLDDEKIWLDYDIVVSRIIDVVTRSIRVADRPQPIHLAVPNVQTTKAGGTVELPLGSTVLIGGLPAESKDGVPRQLLVLVRADRMRVIPPKKAAQPGALTIQRKAAAPVAQLVQTQPAPPEERKVSKPKKKRIPFSLISRILNRAPQQTADPVDLPTGQNSAKLNEFAPAPRN